MPPTNHLIIGASVRAAVQSARAGGIDAVGIDLFHDHDAKTVDKPLASREYPHGFEERIAAVRPASWSYTGGLENAPAMIDRIADHFPLWGMNGAILTEVRDPQLLAAWLEAEGFANATLLRGCGVGTNQSLVVKRVRSSGGLGVKAVQPGSILHRRLRSETFETLERLRQNGMYVQRRLSGDCWGANFVGRNRSAHLLGVCRSLSGRGSDSDGSRPFAYRGSIGPLKVPDHLLIQLRVLGDALANRFGLHGLFGIDCINDGSRVWLLEVNPRYPASLEILERSMGRSCFPFQDPNSDVEIPQPRLTGRMHGKVVWYWPFKKSWRITDEFVSRATAETDFGDNIVDGRPNVADIPSSGTVLKFGQPVMTLIASAMTKPRLLRH